MKCYLITLAILFNSLLLIGNNQGELSKADSIRIQYLSSDNDSLRINGLREMIDYWKRNDYDSLKYYSHKIIQESEKVKDYRFMFKGYYWLMNLHNLYGNYDTALYYGFECVEKFETLDQPYPVIVSHIFIGDQYRAMSQYENALFYLLRGWNLSKTLGVKLSSSNFPSRISSVYYEMSKHDSALLWVDTALIIDRRAKKIHDEIRNLVLKSAIDRESGNYKSSVEALLNILEMTNQGKEYSDYAGLCNNLAHSYRGLGDYKNQVYYAEQGYVYSSKEKAKAISVVSAELLANGYFELNEFKKAFEYLKTYEKLRSEIFDNERDKQISELNTKYQTAEKEQRILIQKIELDEQKSKNQQNKLILVAISFVLFASALIIFVTYRSRIRLKKSNELLNERNKLIAYQNEEIHSYADQLSHSLEKLQYISQSKEALVNMLVHDLKNPLNALVNIDVFEDQNQRTQIVLKKSREMLNLVMNMLDVNQAEHGELSLSKETFIVGDLIETIIKDSELLLKSGSNRILFKSDFDLKIKADKDIFYRVISNFISNAIKFSHSNEIVKIEIEQVEDYIEIGVIDEGIGIDERYHEIIFEKFRQVDQRDSGYIRSTGIGLAFCKLAIESHGYKIGVRSKPEEGSDFYIQIPKTECEIIDSTFLTEEVHVLDILDLRHYDEKVLKVLKCHFSSIKANGVFAISENKELVLEVEKLKIHELKLYLSLLNDSINNMDEEKFEEILNLIRYE
jgi:signal transduction histidine kinase